MKLKLSIVLTAAMAVLLSACAAGIRQTLLTPTPQNLPTEMTTVPDDELVLSWRREGGIAGFCNKVMVLANGAYTVENCGNPPRNGQLTPEQLGQFSAWINEFEPFEDGEDPTTPTYPDQMFVKTIFNGKGSTQAGPDDILAISNFASTLSLESPSIENTPTTETEPEAVLKARDFLAAELGISVDEITTISFKAVEWSDSCLGLGGADEICAQMITPGYGVLLEAQGQQYELHTNTTGSVIRQAP